MWDLESGKELQTLAGHGGEVHAEAVTPDGTLKVWGLERGRELHTLRGHSGSVPCVAVTPDRRLAVSASWDQTLKVCDLETGKPRLGWLKTSSSPATGLAGFTFSRSNSNSPSHQESGKRSRYGRIFGK